MEPPKKRIRSRTDSRLLDDFEQISPLPETIDDSRAAAGTLLEHARRRADLDHERIGRLYAKTYRRLYQDRPEQNSVSPSTLQSGDDGLGEPQHGRRAFLALSMVYIKASPAGATSPDHVEQVLALYDYRRLRPQEKREVRRVAGSAANASGFADFFKRWFACPNSWYARVVPHVCCIDKGHG